MTVPAAAAQVHAIARRHGVIPYDLGHAMADPERRIWVRPKNLVSAGNAFTVGGMIRTGLPGVRAFLGREWAHECCLGRAFEQDLRLPLRRPGQLGTIRRGQLQYRGL